MLLANFIQKLLILLFLILISLTVRPSELPSIKFKFKLYPNGIGIKKFKKGKGEKIEKSKRVFLNVSIYHKIDSSDLKMLNENLFKDFIVGHEEVLPGWDQALLFLNVGDSVLIKIPPNLAYGEKKIGSIQKNSTFYLFVKVLNQKEVFFNHKNFDTINFNSGLKKIVVKKGNGTKPQLFTELKLNYTGYVYSNKGYQQVFETNNAEDISIFIQLGVGKLIKGLDEGIADMEIGEKSTFIIPPKLGYGDNQKGKILPNTTLYYDVELIAFKNPFFKVNEESNTFLTKDSVLIHRHGLHANKKEKISTETIVTFDFIAYYKEKNGPPVVFENSLKKQKPALLRPGSGVGFPKLEENLTFLFKNDSSTICIPNSKLINKKKLVFLPEGADVYFDVYVLDVTPFQFMEFYKTDTIKLKNGLKFLQNLKNTEIKKIDTVKVGSLINVAFTIFYLDSLGNKKILETSRDSRKLLNLTVGNGKNIKGFEDGIVGMTTNENRRIFIPAEQAYGKDGVGLRGIAPNTNLIMDIEYLEILSK